VGIRGQHNISEKVFLPAYADIGVGDSDLTWQVFGGIGYRFEKFEAVLGYRYLKWEFHDNSALDSLDIHGPILGASFRYRSIRGRRSFRYVRGNRYRSALHMKGFHRVTFFGAHFPGHRFTLTVSEKRENCKTFSSGNR